MFHEAYNMVKTFQLTAGQPVSEIPVLLSKDRVALRIKWMEEELGELQSAESIRDQADALTDLMYYLIGAYVEMGIIPDGPFCIVHHSNMEKLSSPAGIIKDADGKVEKPEDWKHPDVLDYKKRT